MNTLYDSTIPVFVRGLTNLRTWLTKAEKHADIEGVPMGDLLAARLAPDMFDLTHQVQYAYFTSLEAAENLSGKPQPEMGYNEQTVRELYASIDRVTGHLGGIEPDDVAESDADTVETFLLPDRRIPAWTYVNNYALPNFYFHTATAYGILRHKGVSLGKHDYIGADPA